MAYASKRPASSNATAIAWPTRSRGAPRTPRLHWSLANIGIEAQRRRTDADGLISLSQAAANLKCAQARRAAGIRSHGSLRFRVPATADLKTLFNTGNVPESVLKDRVQTALTRMAEEKRLKSAESVPDIMKKIFPAAGGFDEAEYEKAVDVIDRTKVYQKRARTYQTKVAAIDKPKLKTVITDCIKLVGECAARSDQSRIGIRLQTLHRQTRLRDGQGRPDHGRGESHRFFH